MFAQSASGERKRFLRSFLISFFIAKKFTFFSFFIQNALQYSTKHDRIEKYHGIIHKNGIPSVNKKER